MSEWKKVKLGEISQYVNDKIAITATNESNYISTDSMLKDRGGIIAPESIPSDGKVTKYQSNDILVSNIRPYFKKIWFSNREGGCSNDVLVFRARKGIISRYLYYILSVDTFFEHMMAGANGTKMPRGNKKLILNYSFDLPPLPTQHRIATILSRYDSLIENYQKQIKLLEEAAQRLYKEWFVDLHFPGHENTKIIDGLPEGWEKKKLMEFTNVIMGQSPKSEYYNNEHKGLPFHQGVGSYGKRFVEDNTYSTSFTRIAEPNSILFSVRAPVGRLNITKNKIIIGRGLAAMKHVKDCQSFLFYLLKDRFFKDNIIGNGAIFASISKDELLNLQFLIPTDGLVQKYEAMAGNIDHNIMKIDSQIRLLTEARDRLLPKLMSGDI